MIQLLGLVLAIVLVVGVVVLRAILGMPFPRQRARWVDARVPSAHAQAFEEAFAALRDEGFGAPRWLLITRTDGEPAIAALRAVLTHADGTRAWLLQPINVAFPCRLLCFYSTDLADGRTAISQPFDPYFDAVQDGALLVARCASEPTWQAQWAAHRAWVDGLGPRQDATAAGPDAARREVEDLSERLRERMLANGRLRRIDDDLAVPRFAFAFRLLRAWLRAPKPPADPRPPTPPQLAHLARVSEIVAERAPARDAQWLLFLASLLLFMLLGGVVWGVAFAAAILLVVVIHEGGHFLAMRAFGYRGMQVLALPLVGGVALGVDARPGATRQAWMSLAGPLPGIVIGWILLWMVATGAAPAGATAALVTLAIAFLAINYLNVLPIPPLDGAHVVSALLPPRWARVETLLLAAAAVGGALLAWRFDMPLISALAALQLFALRANWRLHGTEARLARDAAFKARHRSVRVLDVLEALQADLGPPRTAKARIGEALALVRRLETQPMGAPARLATGAVYLVLLAVPLAWLVLDVPLLGAAPPADAGAVQAAWDADLAAAHGLPLDRLLRAGSDAPLPAPATPEALAAAAERLGSPIPDDMAAAYAISDGAPGLWPLAQVGPAADFVEREVLPITDTVYFDIDGAMVELPAVRMRGWWRVGGDDALQLLHLPQGDPALPGVRWVEFDFEGNIGHARLQDWLATRHAAALAAARIESESRRRIAEGRRRFAAAGLPELFAAATPEPPGLLLRLIVPAIELPPGAAPDALDAAARRLGMALDAQHAAALALHDGFPPLQLLPAARIDHWSAVRARGEARMIAALTSPSAAQDPADPGDGVVLAPALAGPAALDGCLVAAGGGDGSAPVRFPRLVWCPPGHPHAGWIDLVFGSHHRDLSGWMREQAARRWFPPDAVPDGSG